MAQFTKKRRVELSEYDEVMTMDQFPDAVMTKIFSNLASVEKIRLSRVCKQWNTVAHQPWKNADFLSFYGLESRRNPLVDDHINKRIVLKTTNPKIYRKVLSLCGDNIIFLSLSDKIDIFNASILTSIAEYCQNLTHLRINHIYDPYNAGLNQLLCVNKNLELFTISDFNDYNRLARCLRHLPTQTLRELKIRSSEKQLNIEPYIQSLNTLLHKTSLTSLNIDCGDDKTIKTISEHKDIKFLSLRRFSSESDIDFSHISKLCNLIHVDFSYCRNYVNDNVIECIVKNAKNIKILDLNECNQITMIGLSAICTMTKLKKLQLAGVEAVDNYVLDMIPSSVTTLGLALTSINDDGVQSFIMRHDNLIDLDIRDCAITNDTLQAAVDATKYRTNNKVLLIAYTFNPVYDSSPFKGESPLLKLVSTIG
ncbi:hypothetical protein HCN44_006417 [Aphidius gifuensis]|uniref:F-box domain-containing protein n=1 Tax=Aphidius gifuensis TaxID=684658 RepID=A0A834XVK1_APHGI|nr:F-box/LRR-repeat protein 7-like [Aphidius gifuensis]KAF7993357.1 hypothetical protein HCN44_006417 [Aphidius gifuensis]